MKRLLFLIGGIAMLFISITTVSAMTKPNMNSVLSDLTNKTEAEIAELHEEKTYGEIAKEEDVYEEFKEARLSVKIERIEQKVESGQLSTEEGEALKERFLEKAENCDGNKVQMNLGKRNRRGV